MTDSHADRRDAKRRKARLGHVVTNNGLRVVQRALAARAQRQPSRPELCSGPDECRSALDSKEGEPMGCGCECNSGGFCGGCGHRGCGRR